MTVIQKVVFRVLSVLLYVIGLVLLVQLIFLDTYSTFSFQTQARIFIFSFFVMLISGLLSALVVEKREKFKSIILVTLMLLMIAMVTTLGVLM